MTEYTGLSKCSGAPPPSRALPSILHTTRVCCICCVCWVCWVYCILTIDLREPFPFKSISFCVMWRELTALFKTTDVHVNQVGWVRDDHHINHVLCVCFFSSSILTHPCHTLPLKHARSLVVVSTIMDT